MGEKEKLLLPESDREFLGEKYPDFEVLQIGAELHVVLPGFPFPPAYTPNAATLMVIVPAGYPNTALDMFWTYPDIKLVNGNWPNRCDYHHDYGGRSWQRWSRHFIQAWRPGRDNLRTFLATVRSEIAKGI